MGTGHSTLCNRSIGRILQDTVKPFNLAAQKVGDLAFKIILAPLILAN